MRVVFAGTPEFSVPSLRAIAHSKCCELIAVYTQPDRPAGRGKKITYSAIKTEAQQLSVPVFQPDSFSSEEAINTLEQLAPDLMVVAAYGLLLPQRVLDVPKLGCVNVHASLLPRWRGAAPIQRAIEHGDAVTGVTLMQIELKLDSGPILAQQKTQISDQETSASLHDKLAELGGELLAQQLNSIGTGALEPQQQNESEVTYAAKLSKKEAFIDWNKSAIKLERKVRAFNPWPTACCQFNGQVLRIHQARCHNVQGLDNPATDVAVTPGVVCSADKHGIAVQTGNGQLVLQIVQKPGGRALSAAEFLNGSRVSVGNLFS